MFKVCGQHVLFKRIKNLALLFLYITVCLISMFLGELKKISFSMPSMMEEQKVVFWEVLRQEKEVSTLQNYLMSHMLVLKTSI